MTFARKLVAGALAFDTALIITAWRVFVPLLVVSVACFVGVVGWLMTYSDRPWSER